MLKKKKYFEARITCTHSTFFVAAREIELNPSSSVKVKRKYVWTRNSVFLIGSVVDTLKTEGPYFNKS